MIGISSCLGGIPCRYDGGAQERPHLKTLIQRGLVLPVCPEVLGELPVPRAPAEIQGGDGYSVWQGRARVITAQGEDVTEAFKNGAKLAYQKLKAHEITHLIVKEKSPSCGRDRIYNGEFSGIKKTGIGVATAYFLSKGLIVYADEDERATLLIQEMLKK